MNELFTKLLNLSISAGWLVLAIALLRVLFRKAPKWLFPMLWSLVGLRLLIPNPPKSSLSLVPDISEIGVVAVGAVSAKANLASYAGIVWCIGLAGMLLYAIASYIRLRSKLKTAVRMAGNIYRSEYVESPFILGLFAPRIYLPFHMDEQDLDSIIAHERAHIKRGDHLLKPAAFLLLSIHWFNPLIWLAYILLCKDIELACDEHVIREMDDAQRAAYSQALLSHSTNHRHMIAACPLAFGSGDIKKRIRSVLAYHKPRKWIFIASAVLILALAICFMTNPKQNEDNAPSAQADQEFEQIGKLDEAEYRIYEDYGDMDSRNMKEAIAVNDVNMRFITEMLQIICSTDLGKPETLRIDEGDNIDEDAFSEIIRAEIIPRIFDTEKDIPSKNQSD